MTTDKFPSIQRVCFLLQEIFLRWAIFSSGNMINFEHLFGFSRINNNDSDSKINSMRTRLKAALVRNHIDRVYFFMITFVFRWEMILSSLDQVIGCYDWNPFNHNLIELTDWKDIPVTQLCGNDFVPIWIMLWCRWEHVQVMYLNVIQFKFKCQLSLI